MNKIYALTDYKNHFGSKWKASPYRSGFDKNLIKKYFNKYGFEPEFIQFKDVVFDRNFWEGKLVIYTSSEEVGLHYKGFIEDVILNLERLGAVILPGFDFLRANNNKVYMEMLRDRILGEKLSGNISRYYGTLDELQSDLKNNIISFPCVVKRAEGSMSRGVYLANNEKQIISAVKKFGKTNHYRQRLIDIIRKYKYKGYKKESVYQQKFVVQPFIPGLENDWKILVFGNHYYVLKRGIKHNDFRASGSHYNYKAGSKAGLSYELLDKVKTIYERLNVPHLSLDFAYDGKKSYVHEIQAIYFGTSTMEFSDDFYIFSGKGWELENKIPDQEEEYVWGIVHYIQNHPDIIN